MLAQQLCFRKNSGRVSQAQLTLSEQDFSCVDFPMVANLRDRTCHENHLVLEDELTAGFG
jgi:hypothetical protein